jgi:hypothetical protein
MAMTQKIIHVEDDEWQLLPEGQRSELIRNFIKDYNNSMRGDVTDIDIEMTKINIAKLEEEIKLKGSELTQFRNKLEQATKKQEENRLKILEGKKEEISKVNKCHNCGLEIPEDMKVHNFKVGKICNFCYLKSNRAQIMKWLK